MKIALIGYGKMGQTIEKMALQEGHAITCRIDSSQILTADAINEADVCVEFTRPEVALQNIEAIAKFGKPLVIGTSGWYDHIGAVAKLLQEHKVGGIYAENYSIGMQYFMKMVEHAAELINSQDEFDVSGFEAHHRKKADSPSGTAHSLAKILLDNIQRKKRVSFETSHHEIDLETLHFPSLRCGHIPGTHQVIFDSPFETMTLTYEARNRNGYAKGVLLAAQMVQNKTGLYHLRDLL